MCDLGGWDGAIQISGRALADLVVALDQSVRPTVDTYPAATLAGGLTTNGAEQLLNQELLVPRILYATWNPDFDPGPGSYPGADDDLERLHARLSEYVKLTGINITNLNPLQFQITGDPGNRLTFVRHQWYNGTNVPPDIVLQPPNIDGNVQPNTVRLRFSGKVLIGDNFVDGATVLNSPQALDFTMELDYVLRLGTGNFFPLDQLNVGLGSLPFTTLPAPCAAPAAQRLPPLAGRPVWAQNLGTPSLNNPPNTPVGVQWRLTTAADIAAGTATLFTGAPGDSILDPDTGQERWLVVDTFREPASFQDPPDNADNLQSLPRRLLVDKTCNGMAAEAGRSFALLSFDRVFALSIFHAVALTAVQRAAIYRSIMKLDGFLAGAWLNPTFAGDARVPPPNPQQLALLALLGPQAMNVAPLPGDLALPFPPRLVTGDGAPYVESDVIVLQDAATRVFASMNGDTGAIALGGCFLDVMPPADPLPQNFTHEPDNAAIGQDLAIGLSQRVVDRWLIPTRIEPQIREELADEVEGFDEDAFRLDVTLANNRFDIHVRGAGAFDLEVISLDFEFAVDFPLRLRPQPAVARLNAPGSELDGKPVDAAGFPLPDDLSCIAMNLARGDFIANTPDNNPLCFLGYHDPRVPGANLDFQPGGPWVRVSGDGCPTCTLGSDLCPEGTQVPRPYLWREGHFPVPPFSCPFDQCVLSLRPGLELVFLPPSREDVDVDVDFPWWANLIVDLFVGPLVALDPLNTHLVTNALADLIAFRSVYAGLRGGVAGQTPLSPNFTLGWQFFLQHSDPTTPTNDALTISPDGMCLRFRVLIGPDVSLGNWAAAVAAAAGL
jgi:hypothetical protein